MDIRPHSQEIVDVYYKPWKVEESERRPPWYEEVLRTRAVAMTMAPSILAGLFLSADSSCRTVEPNSGINNARRGQLATGVGEDQHGTLPQNVAIAQCQRHYVFGKRLVPVEVLLQVYLAVFSLLLR